MSEDEQRYAAIIKETDELLGAIIRLCQEADYHESSMDALAMASVIIAKLAFNDGPCCVLANAFQIYTTDIEVDGPRKMLLPGMDAKSLIEGMLKHLIDGEAFDPALVEEWRAAAGQASRVRRKPKKP